MLVRQTLTGVGCDREFGRKALSTHVILIAIIACVLLAGCGASGNHAAAPKVGTISFVPSVYPKKPGALYPVNNPLSFNATFHAPAGSRTLLMQFSRAGDPATLFTKKVRVGYPAGMGVGDVYVWPSLAPAVARQGKYDVMLLRGNIDLAEGSYSIVIQQ